MILKQLLTYLVGHEVGRVEADSELADHRDIGACGQRLHERLGPRLGNGSQVVDHVSLSHANAGVDDGERVGVLVRDDPDGQLALAL